MLIVLKYTIRSGDNLSTIAGDLSKCTGVTYQEIATFNGINPNDIHPGQVLAIPDTQNHATGFEYTVRSGDQLGQIASGIDAAAGITVHDILNANPQVKPENLQIGQVIAFPSLKDQDSTVGYWFPTWESEHPAPPDATTGIAFSGWPDPAQAIQDSSAIKNKLIGAEFISLGGGNASGRYNSSNLGAIADAINQGKFVGYQGIAFDIEEGDSGLESDFANCFSLGKANNFQIIVATSHSGPYGISDRLELMESILSDKNVDIISPMLYSGGGAPDNDYQPTSGVPWDLYKNTQARIMPSILKAAWYQDAVTHFRDSFAIELQGYFVWNPAT